MKKISLLLFFTCFSIYCFGSVTPKVEASRVSGVAPLSVFFDATGTTSSDTKLPFHEITYEWDFGDSGSGTWATNGLSKNKANGGVSAHVFEKPGTYNVILTVRNSLGETGTKSVTITVTDPNKVFAGTKTKCFSTDGNFAGCPSGAEKITETDFGKMMSHVAPGVRLLLKRGNSWNVSGTKNINVSEGVIGAFGSGAKPKLTTSVNVFSISGRVPNFNDWRFMDLNIVGTGSGKPAVIKSSGEVNNLTVFRLSFSNVNAGFTISDSTLDHWNANGYPGHDFHQGISVIECEGSKLMGGSGGNMAYVASRNASIMGNNFSNSRGAEHIIRTPYIGKGVIQHNDFSYSSNIKHLLKIHAPKFTNNGIGKGVYTQNLIISDNDLINDSSWAVCLGPQNGSSDERVKDVIFERNILTPHDRMLVAIEVWSANTTIRNNIFHLTSTNPTEKRTAIVVTKRGVEPAPVNTWIYNNTVYSNETGGKPVTLVAAAAVSSNVHIKNNLIYRSSTGSVSMFTGEVNHSNNMIAEASPFVSESPAKPTDYKLKQNSPAVNAGADVPVLRDWSLGLRPANGKFDLGAFEYGTGNEAPVEQVRVKGINIVNPQNGLTVGEEVLLTATLNPTNATNQSVTWTSSNTAVATIGANGKLVGKSAGNTTVTVKTADGGFTDSFNLLVKSDTPAEPDPALNNIALNKPVDAYAAPDSRSPGINITDGNRSTEIESRWSAKGYPKSAIIDLEAIYNITDTYIYPFENRDYQYVIEVSNDGINYKKALDRSNNTKSASVFKDSFNATGRYVKFTFTGATTYKDVWVSIGEIEIAGELASDAIEEGTNIALHKPVTASSQPVADSPAINITDGSRSTGVSSRWSAKTYPEYVVIDLEATYDISKTLIYPRDKHDYQYIVEVSNDGRNFAKVADRSANKVSATVLTDAFNATGRYIKVTFTGAHTFTGSWIEIGEIEAFGTPSNAATISKITESVQSKQEALLVYPNPVGEEGMIYFDKERSGAIYGISNYVLNFAKTSSVNASSLPVGYYTIRFDDGTYFNLIRK